MTLWPGDELEMDSGETIRLGPLMAYRGKEGCTNPMCTQIQGAGPCYGWHCSGCDEPTSMMGHDCPTRKVTDRAA